MGIKQKHPVLCRVIQIFCICCFVFASPLSHATYYGNHYYKNHYGLYGHSYHQPNFGNYYGHHHGYSQHYGAQAYFSGDAALVVLGVLGLAVLTQVFTNNNSHNNKTYSRTYSNTRPVKLIPPVPVQYQKPVTKTIYHYAQNEGWNQLAKGEVDYALDIFAVQSQQNLNSGESKIGFAIAAAAIGEKERAVRAMRKAVRIDANALNNIHIDTIKPTIKTLTKDFQASLNENPADTETSFIAAALAYLQQDYVTANTLIAEKDKSQSANNLRELLKFKL